MQLYLWQRVHCIARFLRTWQNKGRTFGPSPGLETRVSVSLFFSILMGWRVLYIDEGEYLSLYIDNVKITNRKVDKELIIPIKDLHTLIIDNYRTVLSVQLMNAFTRHNVNVVFCDVDHLPKSILVPQHGNNQSSSMLHRQIGWSENIKQTVHTEIVRAKLHNQMNLLKYLDKDQDVIFKIQSYLDEVEIADATNREGLAAKIYFKALFGKEFRRFKQDTLNAGLNYGYSILRSQISKTIIAKGLNPSLGLFHHGPNNQFNLSDDFIEPFRPLIDYYVHEHLRDAPIFTKDHKLGLIRHTTSKISYKKVKQTMFNTIVQYTDNIVAFLETGVKEKLVHPIIDYDEL